MHEAFYSINVFMASSLARNRNSTMLITWDISRKNSFNNHIVQKTHAWKYSNSTTLQY